MAVQKNEEKEGDLIDDFLEEKVRTLSGMLAYIKGEIRIRWVLSEKIIADIYQHYLNICTTLLRITGYRSVREREITLEKQLDLLSRETRQERALCWQDISALNKEFRTWLKQYLDVGQRVRLVLTGGRRKRE